MFLIFNRKAIKPKKKNHVFRLMLFLIQGKGGFSINFELCFTVLLRNYH